MHHIPNSLLPNKACRPQNLKTKETPQVLISNRRRTLNLLEGKCDGRQRLVPVTSPYDLRTLLIVSSFFTIASAANPSTSFIRPPHPPQLLHRKQQQHIPCSNTNFSSSSHTRPTEKAKTARLAAPEFGSQMKAIVSNSGYPLSRSRFNCHSKSLSKIFACVYSCTSFVPRRFEAICKGTAALGVMHTQREKRREEKRRK